MDDNSEPILLAKLGDAFRPGSPIDRYDLFANRPVQVTRVINAVLQPGQHVIMFGERGVGKTSLAKVLSEILEKAGFDIVSLPTLNCDGTDNFSSIWQKVFREIPVLRQRRGLGFTAQPTQEIESLQAYQQKKIKPDDVRFWLQNLGARSLIVIDEIDRIRNGNTTALLADTIKNLSDHSVDVTLILVGVADSVDQLIAEHRSVERSIVQVPVPRMSPEELGEIIDKGLKSAGMSIHVDAKRKIVKLSQGLPHYTHALGLHAAQLAVNNQRRDVVLQDVDRAINVFVEQSYSLKSEYHKATASPQKQNLYAQVLLSCALAEKDDLGYFSAASVSRPMSAIMGKPYSIPAFSRHLSDFCDGDRAVLQRIGVPRRYRYRFVNPLMQPFVVIEGLSRGLVNEETLATLERELAKGKRKGGTTLVDLDDL